MKVLYRLIALFLLPCVTATESTVIGYVRTGSHVRPPCGLNAAPNEFAGRSAGLPLQIFPSQALALISQWVHPPSLASQIYRFVGSGLPPGSAATAPETDRRTLRRPLMSVLRPWIASLAAVTAWGLAQAQGIPSLNVWVPYFRPVVSRLALRNYGNRFSELSIFALRADRAGNLTPTMDFMNEAIHAARNLEPRPRILLTATNDTPKRPKRFQSFIEMDRPT